MSICDWSNFASEWGHLISALRSGSIAPDPFQIMAGPTSTADHAKCAEIYTDKYCSSAEQFSPSQRHSHARIRVAYVSPDFREHPIAHLLAGLFEHHDRSRFETIAIALGPDDDSEMRARLKSAFDRFIDVHDKTDLEAARLVRELGVDIVVDLAGFTTGCRPAILAHRPAPLQITYLSYPGIAKKAFIDYILADPVVIPEDQRALFGQPIVDLPGTYLGYDSSQKISGNPPTRLEQGLPNDGVVFCAFNNTFKIGPELFGIWMRILRQSDNSVLWLSGTSDAAVANLRHEAEARGIDADRLCFAPYMKSRADYLGRYRLADLFLDTLPFNAQTTACDALWAGLPVLSRLGSTFVGRVAASVLGVMGLPELITHSEEEYEALALKLAKNPSMIADLKNKVALNRHTCRIFDPERFRRGIEAAYEAIYERYQKGLPPCHIRIQS
jgi:predicted O-linked N-acetylglucosamine transferase (SPINDLY family)